MLSSSARGPRSSSRSKARRSVVGGTCNRRATVASCLGRLVFALFAGVVFVVLFAFAAGRVVMARLSCARSGRAARVRQGGVRARLDRERSELSDVASG